MEMLDFQDVMLLIAVIVAAIVVVILFLVTLQNTLKLVNPQYRSIQPGAVWFILIPFLGMLWQFVVVRAVAKSCKAQLEQYNIVYSEKPTYNAGLGWSVCQLLSTLIGAFTFPALILFIMYWVKISEVKQLLQQSKILNDSKDENSIL